eukprot:UC4_evm1s672
MENVVKVCLYEIRDAGEVFIKETIGSSAELDIRGNLQLVMLSGRPYYLVRVGKDEKQQIWSGIPTEAEMVYGSKIGTTGTTTLIAEFDAIEDIKIESGGLGSDSLVIINNNIITKETRISLFNPKDATMSSEQMV